MSVTEEKYIMTTSLALFKTDTPSIIVGKEAAHKVKSNFLISLTRILYEKEILMILSLTFERKILS